MNDTYKYKLDINNILNHIVSITDLGRGKATLVLNTIIKEKTPFIIFKNNKPRAAIVDIDVYKDLVETKKKFMDIIEEEYLYQLADKRIANHDPSKTMDFEDLLKKYGVSSESLDATCDDVEFED